MICHQLDGSEIQSRRQIHDEINWNFSARLGIGNGWRRPEGAWLKECQRRVIPGCFISHLPTYRTGRGVHRCAWRWDDQTAGKNLPSIKPCYGNHETKKKCAPVGNSGEMSVAARIWFGLIICAGSSGKYHTIKGTVKGITSYYYSLLDDI